MLIDTTKDRSIYIHSTSTINTKNEATTITITGGGGKDIDIYIRVVVTGAVIGSNGVEYSGEDSIINIDGVEDVYINTAIVANDAHIISNAQNFMVSLKVGSLELIGTIRAGAIFDTDTNSTILNQEGGVLI